MWRALLGLVSVGVSIYALVDCLRAPQQYVRGPKYAWILAILILPLLGGLLYLSAGREMFGRGRTPSMPGRLSSKRPTTIAPDDDPDFLRSLNRPTPQDPSPPIAPPAADAGENAPPSIPNSAEATDPEPPKGTPEPN